MRAVPCRLRAGPLAAAIAVLLTAGCEPVHEGPQLTEVPDGLGYLTAIDSARKPLPARRSLGQVGHVPPGSGSWDTSAIITTYEGLASRDELEAARADYARRYRSTVYGPVEPITVGERPGFAYATEEGGAEGRRTVGLVAMVPWDRETYTIELRSSDARWQAPATQRAIVSSFEVARRGRYKPVLTALLAAVLAGWAVAAYLRRKPG